MRVPHFLMFTLGLSAALALFGCSRESSVKENVNLKNNHSRVFAFDKRVEDGQSFIDAMADTPVNEADTIPDTLTVTVNDTVYLIGLLPYNVDKIYRFQWTLTKKNGKDTTVVGDNAAIVHKLAVSELGPTGLAVTECLHAKITAKGVHRLGADAVKADRLLEHLAVVLGTCIELADRLHQLAQRDAAAIVAYADTPLGKVYLHLYFLAIA